jgi:hypothetical protein
MAEVVSKYPYGFSMKAESRLDFAVIALKMFNLKQEIKEMESYRKTGVSGSVPVLQDRYIHLMAYFLLYGYSLESRRRYAEINKYTEGTIAQFCSALRGYGYIVQNRGNQRQYDLSPAMKGLAAFVKKRILPEYIKCFIFLVKEDNSGYQGELRLEHLT